jgi:hypothetical protein
MEVIVYCLVACTYIGMQRVLKVGQSEGPVLGMPAFEVSMAESSIDKALSTELALHQTHSVNNYCL